MTQENTTMHRYPVGHLVRLPGTDYPSMIIAHADDDTPGSPVTGPKYRVNNAGNAEIYAERELMSWDAIDIAYAQAVEDALLELDDILQDHTRGMELVRVIATHLGITIEDVPTQRLRG